MKVELMAHSQLSEKWFSKFKDLCDKKYCCIPDYDGQGYYLKDDKVYELYASPRMIRNGFVRNEFTHVCWYNK